MLQLKPSASGGLFACLTLCGTHLCRDPGFPSFFIKLSVVVGHVVAGRSSEPDYCRLRFRHRRLIIYHGLEPPALRQERITCSVATFLWLLRISRLPAHYSLPASTSNCSKILRSQQSAGRASSRRFPVLRIQHGIMIPSLCSNPSHLSAPSLQIVFSRPLIIIIIHPCLRAHDWRHATPSLLMDLSRNDRRPTPAMLG